MTIVGKGYSRNKCVMTAQDDKLSFFHFTAQKPKQSVVNKLSITIMAHGSRVRPRDSDQGCRKGCKT